jgi:hypothetical protein
MFDVQFLTTRRNSHGFLSTAVTLRGYISVIIFSSIYTQLPDPIFFQTSTHPFTPTLTILSTSLTPDGPGTSS